MPHSLDLTDLTVVYASLLDLIDLIVVNFILVRLLGRPPKCPRVNQGNNVGSPTALCFGIPRDQWKHSRPYLLPSQIIAFPRGGNCFQIRKSSVNNRFFESHREGWPVVATPQVICDCALFRGLSRSVGTQSPS